MLNQMFITVAGAAALALPIATVADNVGSHGQSGVAGKSPVAQVLPESAVSAGTDVQVSTTAAPRLVSEIPADANSSGASSAVDPTLEVAPATASPVVVRHVKVNAPSASPQPVAAPSAAVPTASAPDESVSMMTRATTDPPVDPATQVAQDGSGTSDSSTTTESLPAREAAQGKLNGWQDGLTPEQIKLMAPDGTTGFETPEPTAGHLSLNDAMKAFDDSYRLGTHGGDSQLGFVGDPMAGADWGKQYHDAYKAAVDAWFAANS